MDRSALAQRPNSALRSRPMVGILLAEAVQIVPNLVERLQSCLRDSTHINHVKLTFEQGQGRTPASSDRRNGDSPEHHFEMRWTVPGESKTTFTAPPACGGKCRRGWSLTSAAYSLCSVLLARNIQDVIGRFLRLGGRMNHELTIIAKLFQPTLNVGCLVLDDGWGDSGFGAQKGSSHLCDQFFGAVHRRTKGRGFRDRFTIQAGSVACCVKVMPISA